MFKEIAKIWKKLPTGGKIAVGGVAAFGLYKGVKFFRSRIAHVPLPTGGMGIPVTGYSPNGSPIAWSPAGLVDQLYSAMSGLGTFSGTKDEVWQQIINLPSADMLTATYNAFNHDSRSEGESLTQWIDNENYYDYLSGVKAATLAKLRAANLT